MAFKIRRVDYFYTTVKDQPGEAYKLLSLLSSLGINLLAFTAIPFGPMTTQLAIFPEDTGKLMKFVMTVLCQQRYLIQVGVQAVQEREIDNAKDQLFGARIERLG